MSFGEYSSACAGNGGSAYVDSSGIYQCSFSSGSSGGSGSSGSGGGGGRSAQPPAPNAANQMMLNVMQAASPYVQQAIHDALYGNPAEAAAREAEQRRQAEEKARKDEATKARLLGESNEPGQMSMMGLQTNGGSLQMMTGDDALQAMEARNATLESELAARARRADRMAERDRAAVDVDSRGIERQVPQDGQDLRREGFIQLDQLEVAELQAGAIQELADRGHRSDAHHARIDAGGRPPDDPREGLQAAPKSFVFLGQHDGRATVRDAR